MSTSDRPVLVVAPDKFRGTLSAAEVVAAVTAAAHDLGWEVLARPLADGGEGTLEALGGANRRSTVTGPGGTPVEAGWRLDDGLAVIESARASGLALAGGSERNDPMAATSAGTGELVAQAVLDGARRIILGLGGSAMTDGGQGAVEAVLERLDGDRPTDRGVELVAASDVTTVFTDAARVFGPQKGASPEQVVELTERLGRQQEAYRERFGVDLGTAPGGGAAGGLGGAVLVLGGRVQSGFDLVAEAVGLDAALDRADAVVTGEGALDAASFEGKVVGSLADRAGRRGLPVLVLAGTVREDLGRVPRHLSVVDLSRTFGAARSWRDTAACVTEAVRDGLPALRGS